jgi:UDP-N-acetylglucosamine:LPS N-acetylglucosamine transferase
LAVLGKPTVLIPNYQMAGHQVENARVLSRAGAVRVLDGAKLTVEQLVGEVKRLLDDRKSRGDWCGRWRNLGEKTRLGSWQR